MDRLAIELPGTRLFVEDEDSWGRWATAPSGISPSRSTTKSSVWDVARKDGNLLSHSSDIIFFPSQPKATIVKQYTLYLL